jgi:hypothetical protein
MLTDTVYIIIIAYFFLCLFCFVFSSSISCTFMFLLILSVFLYVTNSAFREHKKYALNTGHRVSGTINRQCLPIMPNASRSDIVRCCMHRSPIWRNSRRYQLHINMQAQLATDATEASAASAWAAYLTRIGDGTEPTYPQVILLFSHPSTRV